MYREEIQVGWKWNNFEIKPSNQSNINSHGLEPAPTLTMPDSEVARYNPSVEQSWAAAAWQRYAPWQRHWLYDGKGKQRHFPCQTNTSHHLSCHSLHRRHPSPSLQHQADCHERHLMCYQLGLHRTDQCSLYVGKYKIEAGELTSPTNIAQLLSEHSVHNHCFPQQFTFPVTTDT